MTNALALKIGGFTALVSTSLLGSTSAATAANVGGCGLEPDGGNLTNVAGVCELEFTTGTHSWSLPAGITGLHGVLVGAGGGATSNGDGSSMGYAGAGGAVEYADLTTSVAGDTIVVVVGDGGAYGFQSDAGDGGDSTMSVNGGTPYRANGGNAGDSNVWGWGYCGAGSFGENVGAGVAGAEPAGSACVGGGPGIVPDSDPDAPAIFEGFTDELARGGGVYIDTPHTNGTGDGGSIYVDTKNTPDSSDDGVFGGPGVWGTVIFRYPAADANNVADTDSLAETGNDMPVGEIALASIAAIAAGLAASAFGRRAAKSSR